MIKLQLLFLFLIVSSYGLSQSHKNTILQNKIWAPTQKYSVFKWFKNDTLTLNTINIDNQRLSEIKKRYSRYENNIGILYLLASDYHEILFVNSKNEIQHFKNIDCPTGETDLNIISIENYRKKVEIKGIKTYWSDARKLQVDVVLNYNIIENSDNKIVLSRIR